MAVNQAQKTSIVLNGPNGWTSLVETKANSAEAWKYIDPHVNDDRLPVLEKPQYPSAADIKAGRALPTIPTSSESPPAERVNFGSPTFAPNFCGYPPNRS